MGVAFLARANWPQFPVRAIDKWIVGVDLGQSIDPTAICALHHRVVPLDKWTPNDRRQSWRQERETHLDVRYLLRLPLGMAYPGQVQEVALLKSRPPLNAAELVTGEGGSSRGERAVHRGKFGRTRERAGSLRRTRIVRPIRLVH